MTNTLAYFDAEYITAVESFIVSTQLLTKKYNKHCEGAETTTSKVITTVRNKRLKNYNDH